MSNLVWTNQDFNELFPSVVVSEGREITKRTCETFMQAIENVQKRLAYEVLGKPADPLDAVTAFIDEPNSAYVSTITADNITVMHITMNYLKVQMQQYTDKIQDAENSEKSNTPESPETHEHRQLWEIMSSKFPNAEKTSQGIAQAIQEALDTKSEAPATRTFLRSCTHVTELRQTLKTPCNTEWNDLLNMVLDKDNHTCTQAVTNTVQQFIPLAYPPRFDGTIAKFPSWRKAVERFIQAEHRSFVDAFSAAAWTLGLLEGRAAELTNDWTLEEFAENQDPSNAVSSILSALALYFVDPLARSKATLAIRRLKQGTTPFTEFFIEFSILARLANFKDDLKKNELIASMNSDLREAVRAHAANLPESKELEELDYLVIKEKATFLEPSVLNRAKEKPMHSTEKRSPTENTPARGAPIRTPFEKYCLVDDYDEIPAVPERLRYSLGDRPRLRQTLINNQICLRCRRPRSEHAHQKFSADYNDPTNSSD